MGVRQGKRANILGFGEGAAKRSRPGSERLERPAKSQSDRLVDDLSVKEVETPPQRAF